MYRLLWVLFGILAVTIASGNTVAQKVMFSGFPGGTSYYTTYTTSYDGGGQVAVVLEGSSLKNSSSVTATYPYFLPTDPIEYSDEQYRAVCDDLDASGSCHANFTSTLYYGNAKSCIVNINLEIKNDVCFSIGGCINHSHSNSISGDCSIKGGDGDDLWTVTPKG